MFIHPSRISVAKSGATGPIASASQRLAPPSAFTLIEVVVGLTILAMITGTLFAIIRTSVRTAASVEQMRRENDAINRFVELCRQTFHTLPSTATLTLAITEQAAPALQELTITGAPTCFGFGPSPISYKDSIIGLRPDTVQPTTPESGLPRYDLSLSREDLIPQTDENAIAVQQDLSSVTAVDEQGRYWMPLLPGVQSLTWRFYVTQDEVWLEEWDDSKWPDLIEMNLTMEGRTLPLRAVFSLPTLQLTQARSTGSSSTSTTTTSTSTTGGGGGGGGPQPGGGGTPQGGGGGGGR
jgi:prepilin-type N-terminal cleavage/methylation domain-containing protein